MAEIWRVRCGNEWCNGPETIAIRDHEPPDFMRCPVCGWTACVWDGIERLRNQEVSDATD